jgi:sugar lactone lactonase YvrE
MTSKHSFRSLSISIILPLILLVFPARIGTAAERAKTGPVDATKGRAAATYVKLPLSFEVNQGQTDPRVKFLSRGSGYTLFLTGNEAVLSLKRPSAATPQQSASRGLPLASGLSRPAKGNEPRMADVRPLPLVQNPKSQIGNGPAAVPESLAPDVVRLKLVGANPEAQAVGLDPLPGKSNYFIGNDPKKWRTNVPNYARVKYQEIYPGIDLVYYGNQQQLEYDFVVAPGADPSVVTLEVGVEGIRPAKGERGSPLQIAADGDLVIHLGGGEVRFHKPVVYQPVINHGQWPADSGERTVVEGHYVLTASNQVRFALGPYDHTRLLVIDPALIYSTYLGGSSYDYGSAIAVDSSGSAYVAGATASADFPVTVGARQTTYGGGMYDAFVAKLNSTGSALAYSTYLGGSGDDVGSGVAVDSSGNAYVVGTTGSSTNFPLMNPLQATYGGGDFDAFVAKLNATGSELVYSTYLGGDYEDDGIGIAVDASGNAYVTGATESTTFPTKNAFQATNYTPTSFGTGFVAKLNSAGSALVYSTYLGGSDFDQGFGIAVDSSGNAYVTGQTHSTDFPTTTGALQTELGGTGAINAFVTELNPAGSALVYSTYLGGSSSDYGEGIAVDSSGNAYVTGLTSSTNFPTEKPLQASNKAEVKSGFTTAFVAELKSGGSALAYSTYLGGSYFDQGFGIAIDSFGDAYVTGQTHSSDFPTFNALQATNESASGSGTAFVAELNSTGSALVYSTYLGGSSSDSGAGIAVDSSGDAYVTGQTSSTNFPTVYPLQATLGATGATNAFVAKIPAFWVSLSQNSLAFGSQDVGTTTSLPLTLTNTGTGPITVNVTIPPGFTVVTDDCSGVTLDVGDKCTITIASTPTDVGTETGQLIISGAPGGPVVVSLTVQGILTPGNIATLAGGGLNSTGALSAYVAAPNSLATDKVGNIYVSLQDLNQVYKITPSGSFVLVAGTESAYYSGDGGPGTNAALNSPGAVAVDASGNLYIADRYNSAIRKVNASTSIITTVAGNGAPGYGGDNGPAISATLNAPSGVAIDAAGDIFIADGGNNIIRLVSATTGIITTVAGNRTACSPSTASCGDGSPATSASLNISGFPDSQQIALDSLGNLYIADTNDNRIRVVNMQTTQITVAGVAIQPQNIATVAGNGVQGSSGNGPATSAELTAPFGVAVDAAGNIYFADSWSRIRVVNPQTTTSITVAGVTIPAEYIATVAGTYLGFGGDGGLATSAGFTRPAGVAIDASGDVLIADSGNNRVRIVTASTGIVTTLAGGGSGGDGGLATSAVVATPNGVAVDNSGNLYFVEGTGERIRRVDASSGNITTVAGNTTGGYSGDYVPATSTNLNSPYSVAVDSSGNVFIADSWNQRIRVVNMQTTQITVAGVAIPAGYINTVAGNGTECSSSTALCGDGGLATSASLSVPNAVSVDTAEDFFIADWANNRIRRVDGTSGTITTVAGNGTACPSSTAPCGDGGPATSASLDYPTGVAVDTHGNLFIADGGDNRIRVVNTQETPITVAGVTIPPLCIATVAGNGTEGFSGDGGPATSASLNLEMWSGELSLDNAGNLFIPDWLNNRVRRVDAVTGIITTVAGGGPWTPSLGDGGPAVNAYIPGLEGVAVDTYGHLFISDDCDNRIREVLLAPAVTLSTTILSFGNQVVGATSPAQVVTVTNSGGANLTITSILTSGDYAQANTCPATLNPGSTCAISVSFTPTTTGSLSGTVTITDNAAGSPQTVDLSGTGVLASTTGPAVSLTPASLSFPATSSSQSVTLTNSGGYPLTIYSIVTSPTPDYQQTNLCPIAPNTLAPLATCSITVTFTPTVASTDLGMLTITDNAGTGTQSVPLAATYTTPQQQVSAGYTYTFANGTIVTETVALPSDVNMGSTASKAVSFIPMSPAAFSASRLPGTVQYPNWSGGITPIPAATTCTVIANTGGNCIVIRDLCYNSGGGSIPCDITEGPSQTPIQLTAQYETPSSPVCPGYIIADDNQTDWAIITNEYFPSDTGIGGGTKTLNTDTTVVDLGAANCVTSITGPGVSLAPPSLVFPAVAVGNSSLPQGVTLTNTGVLPLTISNIATSGDYNVNVPATTCPMSPNTLAPLATCSISVTFKPTVASTDPGMLTITDNASNSPQSVPLAATYTTPPVQVSPGTSTKFTNGTIMTETVLLPPDAVMNGTYSKAVSFIPLSPAAFSSTRLPPTTQTPDWSGGITPIPAATTCTVIGGTGGNCMVVRDLCFDNNGNSIACDIVAPTIPIQLTAQYQTSSSPACPGYIIADDGLADWAIITNEYSPSDTGIGGGTKTLNTDTAVVDLGAGNCASVTLTITATPSSTSMTYGGTVPTISPTYSVNAPANLTTPPSCSTFATSSSPVGTYPSICWGAVDDSYTIWYVDGTVTVTQATPVLAWTPASIELGYPLTNAQLDATANVPGTFVYTPPLGTVINTTSQTLSVVFTPTDTKDYTNAKMSVPLTVTPGPLASVSPSSINFGTVHLATITVKSVTVTNVGNAPMTISTPFFSILSGGTLSEFVAVNLCPSSLPAGKSCTIEVSFIAGPCYSPQTATLSIVDNAYSSPQKVVLSATVINPQAWLSATSLSFGTVKVSKSSAAQAVTLKNTGATTLTISTIALAGADPGDFPETNNCPASLAPTASCTINVTFTPTAKGSRSGKVVITDNAWNSPQSISLSGTGN